MILSSHILSEIQAVCDAVLIISKGKLVACDTTQNLEALFTGSNCLSLTVKATEEEVRTALAKVDGIQSLSCTPEDGTTQVELVAEGQQDLAEPVFFAFADLRRPIVRMNAVRASLEEVFIELTQNADAPVVPVAPPEATTQQEEGPTDDSNL